MSGGKPSPDLSLGTVAVRGMLAERKVPASNAGEVETLERADKAFPRHVRMALRAEARRRDLSMDRLIRDIVDGVIERRLFGAVLDDDWPGDDEPGRGLTRRQRQLRDWIEDYRAAHGIMPSYEDMREGLGLASRSGIHRLVSGLEKRGHLTRTPNCARSLTLTKQRRP